MTGKPNIPNAVAELRRRAEARMPARQKGQGSTSGEKESRADIVRVVHELEVHQIELEMQNKALEEARAKLESLLEKYTDLYDFAPVGYVTLDQEGAIGEGNLAAASLLGIARRALAKRNFGFFVSTPDRQVFTDFLGKTFANGVREECEVNLVVENKAPMDVRMEAIVFESGEACRVAITDITEHKRVEADRLILNKLESTGILAGGIAHDFNNLLTVILLNLEMAQMLAPSAGELTGYLDEAKQTSLLARGLTAQLVTFADGGLPLRRATNLSTVIRESVRPVLGGSNVLCEYSLAQDLWVVEVDGGQIGQVIRNLALNAREAMPAGGTVFVRAENVVLRDGELTSLPPGEYIRVSVADQGAGIPPAELTKIFDPYFSTKKRAEQKGMGLGLTICHAIIQKHGGTIAVKSELGVGTTFQFYLPAARELSDMVTDKEKASAPWRGRVLVMEDEEGLQKAVGLALWAAGHAVELAGDGKKAVEIYQDAQRKGRPLDVALLDLTIRGAMGGRETVQALLKIDPNVKAIAMSGHINDPVMLEPERHGFKATLAKPFDAGKLQEILSRVMTTAETK